MINRISTLALIACLGSSLAFAGEKTKANSSASETSAITVESTSGQAMQDNGPCAEREQKPARRNAKPTDQTDQEEQFNRVLQGIYG